MNNQSIVLALPSFPDSIMMTRELQQQLLLCSLLFPAPCLISAFQTNKLMHFEGWSNTVLLHSQYSRYLWVQCLNLPGESIVSLSIPYNQLTRRISLTHHLPLQSICNILLKRQILVGSSESYHEIQAETDNTRLTNPAFIHFSVLMS